MLYINPKKSAEHGHVQRLAKAAWTGKKYHFCFQIKKFFDKKSLVGIVATVVNYFCKFRYSERQRPDKFFL